MPLPNNGAKVAPVSTKLSTVDSVSSNPLTNYKNNNGTVGTIFHNKKP